MFLIDLLSTSKLFWLWAIVVDDRWQPGIGDPSVIGWVTVVIYFVTASFCFGAAWQTCRFLPTYRIQHYYWLWLGLGTSLVLLGINKQLDLQSWLTQFGKMLSLSQGWYLQRRLVQVVFIISIVSLFILLSLRLRKLIGRDWKIFRLTFLGFLFLSSFILIRATSFHHVDRLLGFHLARIRVNWILELGGLSCIVISCLKYLRQLQKLSLKFRREDADTQSYSYDR